MIEDDPRYQRAIRDAEIKRLRFSERWSLQRIANRFSLTRERIRQIVGNTGHTFAAKRALERATSLQAKAEEIEAGRTDDFWSNVDVKEADECWEWTGAVDPNGYGRFHGNYAHRVSYIMAKGAIPVDLEVAHLCLNSRCVNPKHLMAATHSENMQMGRKDQ